VRPDDWRRYLAPAAFLLAATIAVVLIRSGLEAGGGRSAATSGGSSAPRRHVVATTTTTARTPAKRFWVVRAGDTFAVISSKTGVTVATLVRLNPKVHTTSLFIGERIRLK
jgi:LysM repeat protein